jgi:hypothetical protein
MVGSRRGEIYPARDPEGARRRNTGIETRRIPMQKLLWAAALAALAAFPATAKADGIAFAGVENARTGVSSPGGGSHFVTLVLPTRMKQTVVTRVGPNGTIFNYGYVHGHWGIPIVAFDGSKAGLSADGRILVLAQPPIGQMRKVSKFPVLSTRNLQLIKTVVLQGSFSFDAVSPDGKTLYLIEHVNRQDVAQYRVRAYDLESDRLLPKPIRDPKTGEIMHGYPVSRATSADGRWAYTLYQAPRHSFVHALDTVNRSAACIDLPADARPEYVADSRLVVGSNGDVTVDSRSGGVLAVIDTKRHTLRPDAPTAPEASDGSFPWLLAGAALAVALVAATLRTRRLRPVPAVVADEGRDQPGEGEAWPHLDEQPRPVRSIYVGYEPADGDPDAGGEGRQEEHDHGRLVPGPAEAYPEHVVGKSTNGHNGSREDARQELLRRGSRPRGDAYDRRRQPGREHQPA